MPQPVRPTICIPRLQTCLKDCGIQPKEEITKKFREAHVAVSAFNRKCKEIFDANKPLLTKVMNIKITAHLTTMTWRHALAFFSKKINTPNEFHAEAMMKKSAPWVEKVLFYFSIPKTLRNSYITQSFFAQAAENNDFDSISSAFAKDVNEGVADSYTYNYYITLLGKAKKYLLADMVFQEAVQKDLANKRTYAIFAKVMGEGGFSEYCRFVTGGIS